MRMGSDPTQRKSKSFKIFPGLEIKRGYEVGTTANFINIGPQRKNDHHH